MSTKRNRVSLIIVILVAIIALLTLPGYFRYFQRIGTGHAFREIAMSENLTWDSMSQTERGPYVHRADAVGLKCAVLMTLGQHIPFCLFILITVGLFTRSISHGFRFFLRFAFFGVWLFGMFFLSLGTEYWGQGTPFPETLGPSFLIYLAVVSVFGIILGIGILYRRSNVPR
jgi:hypothetical protein